MRRRVLQVRPFNSGRGRVNSSRSGGPRACSVSHPDARAAPSSRDELDAIVAALICKPTAKAHVLHSDQSPGERAEVLQGWFRTVCDAGGAPDADAPTLHLLCATEFCTPGAIPGDAKEALCSVNLLINYSLPPSHGSLSKRLKGFLGVGRPARPPDHKKPVSLYLVAVGETELLRSVAGCPAELISLAEVL